ncbi:probable serine/threonine-protein kinase PIX13 isoform X4 [Syzygium oleosum]|uniref:probable serine/threonine-protein kinase PIX13 isoform X4 n=1 Tax=Syzygium oleosum TaxID=219896 RepID=UPI0024B99051|nr:probable serine/threonine-protein kinase PIX13 isoform X4 [Syzygium oleosum]
MGVCYGTPDFPTPSFTGYLRSGRKLTVSSSSSSAASSSHDLVAAGDNQAFGDGEVLADPNLTVFSFAELKEATKNFGRDTVIGEGGFGYVHKGVLRGKEESGRTETIIAVKRLKPDSVQGYTEWRSYTVKLSDFGLVKSGPREGMSHVSTRVMGTRGYAAPEYIAAGHLYVKSDVYSFGVVLLEILTGSRACDLSRPVGKHLLVEWARPLLSKKKKPRTIMDSRLKGKYYIDSAFQIAQLALTCIRADPNQRPSMTKVVEELESIEAASANRILRNA